MLTNGPNLGLLDNGEYGEANYHELLRMFRALDLLVQPRVKSAVTNIPANPAEGDAYIVPAGALGVWAGHTGKIARYTKHPAAAQFTEATQGWEFFTPKKGWHVFNEHTNDRLEYTGAEWVAFGSF